LTASPPVPIRRLAWLAAVALSLIATGCGAGGDANADPAKVAPQGSLFYGVATIRPEGDQKDAVDSIARKVFRTANPGERIQRELDQAFKEDPETRDTTYAEDIEPWVGRRAAVVLTQVGPGNQTQGAAIIASKDNGKASQSVVQGARDEKAAKRTYKAVTYYYDASDTTAVGVIGDYVVIANEPALKAVVDASKTKGLADKPDFENAASGAQGQLGFGYFDLNALVGRLNASGQIPPAQAQAVRSLLKAGSKPVTMALDADTGRMSLEVVARGVQQQAAAQPPTELVAAIPGDSWLAFGARLRQSVEQVTSQLGGSLEAVGAHLRAQTGLDLQRDVLAALGDMAVFVRGAGILTLGGGVVIKSSDPAAARRLVAKLGSLIEREGQGGARSTPTTIDGARGIRVTSAQMPGAINAVVKGDTLVIAYGDQAAKEAFTPVSRLSDSPDYKAARESLGGAEPTLFVAFGPIAELVGLQSDAQAQQAKTYLSGLKTLAMGSRQQGDTQTARFVLSVR
jgi:hypothetical protein